MKINLNRTAIQKTYIFIYLIFICNSLVAQNEEVSKIKSHEINSPQKLFLLPFSTDLQHNSSNTSTFKNYFTPTNNKIFRLNETNPFTRISFNQNKIENNLTGLGSYEFFNNSLNYRINNNTKVEIGMGLARQNSVLFAAKPNYQIGFQTSLEFAVNPKLDAFIYGQYFTSPVNKSKDFFDPFIYQNPLFLQSEVGAGVKRDYKNVDAKFQINTNYDNKNGQFAPINSKIIIGF